MNEAKKLIQQITEGITFMTRKQRIPFPCYKQKLNIDYLISTYK